MRPTIADQCLVKATIEDNMFKSEFCGRESILLEKVVRFRERQGSGEYVFETRELERVIVCYKNSNDRSGLEQIVRELFSICNQGRRPWTLEAEQAFLELSATGYHLLTYLRVTAKIPNETYAFIDPLSLAGRLGSEAARIEKFRDRDRENWDWVLPVFYRQMSIFTKVFSCWASDHPQSAHLPSLDTMKCLLETEDDVEFAALLTAFSRTRSSQVRQFLLEFTEDDEESVRSLAGKLLSEYF